MIKTDILIVGAGPVGLFTVFEAGLMKLHCHIIDTIPMPGGQLKEIYPKKPIYDIPGFPSVNAGVLIDQLLEQAAPFRPGFTLGERAETIERLPDETFLVTTNEGTKHNAPVIIIAGGLGSFEPRKPLIDNLEKFEKSGVDYFIREPKDYLDIPVLISGGGDSALDWALYFSENSSEKVGVIHRSEKFRGHVDSVEKLHKYHAEGKIDLYLNAEVVGLKGSNFLTGVTIKKNSGELLDVPTTFWLPLFGLSPKLGPISNWGLKIDKNAIVVNNSSHYETSIPGIFAVGDVNTYPGKLKLILCGFHETTMAVQAAYKIINPGKRFTMKYTTVQGIQAFS